MIRVVEKTLQEVKTRFESLSTDLVKMEYLESVAKSPDTLIDVKKFVFSNLAGLYEKRLMYDKAAKSYFLKASYDTTYREKIDSYVRAAENYARAANLMSADDMFLRAVREGNSEQQKKIMLERKNMYLRIGKELEVRGRMSSALKFYEHLLTLKLEGAEKEALKQKLIDYYKRIGKFNEAKSIESK